MGNPIYPVLCPKDQWTLVAENVVTGQIHRKSEKPSIYFHTYRLTGEAAPTTIDEGIKLFMNSVISEPITASSGIDVYIWTTEEDGVVRVDL